MLYSFAPAIPGDRFVFGAAGPYLRWRSNVVTDVEVWVSFMQGQGISRVVCLLSNKQLGPYAVIDGGLLGLYRESFGEENVCSAPVEDFHLIDADLLDTVLAFIASGVDADHLTVVHCLAGIGRTPHVLAAWLTYSLDIDPFEAIQQVQAADLNRKVREAVGHNGVTEDQLLSLLKAVHGQGRILK